MAAKTGQFQGLDGHNYQVVLRGMGVTAEPLLFAGESPVVISMAAGERKFVGFKSQTAKVKIVTDHPMLELYGNSATSVTLVIADTTSQSILFSGYVVPFAYSQPYSGFNDVIEIEAVDSITARKEIAYTNFGTPHGTDRSGLAIVQELCRRAGISRIVEHINFSKVDFTGESPLNISVAQAGFLQDEVSEVDVMAAICKFFGLTSHVFGDTLYLYDEHYLTHSDAKRTTDVNIYLYSGRWSKTQTYHEGSETQIYESVDLTGNVAKGTYKPSSFNIGDTVTIETSGSGSWRKLKENVKKGDIITITGLGGGTARLYFLLDMNNVIQAIAGSGESQTNFTLNVENDGVLYCNFDYSSPYSVVRKSLLLSTYDLSPLAAQGIYASDGILSGVTINVERAYDGVQITPEGSDTSVLLPDVCAEENLDENDNSLGTSVRTYQDYNTNPDKEEDYIQWRVPLKSKLIDAGASSSNGPTNWPSGGDKMIPVSGENSWWDNGCIPIRLIHAPRKRYSVGSGTEGISAVAQSPQNMLWLRLASTGYVAKQKHGYSHTNGLVELKMSYSLVTRGKWNLARTIDAMNGTGYVSFVQIKVGDQYFNRNVSVGMPQWSASPESLFASENGKLLPTIYASNNYDDKVLISVPNNGEILLELRWNIVPLNPEAFYEYPDVYINSLSIQAVGSDIESNDRDMRHEYSENPKELLEAKTMLTSRFSTSGVLDFGIPSYIVNARPSVVPATNWVGGYMARSSEESIPISGILMEQLRERYGEPHTAYTMTVGKMLYPYKPTAYEGKKYTIESYDLDLYNTETTVTIN